MHRTLVRLALLLVVAGCAGPLASRSWRLPETPEAKDCFAQCQQTRRLCSSRRMASDYLPERTAHNTTVGTTLDQDTLRAQRCDRDFDTCVGACPGAVKR